MQSKKRFNKILADIKSVRIQGARNIARAALYAYSINKTKEAKKKLISARVTEPMLVNTLNNLEKLGYKKTLAHFSESQNAINKNVLQLIKNNSRIFTHCHSTNVVKALIYAKKKRKNFQVYNTETRPLFQGRVSSRELARAGIKVTQFVDSAIRVALEKENKKDRIYADAVFLGADAVLKSGAINKIGSGMIAELAFKNKTPVYIIADSWKYSPSDVKIEERDFHEVWTRAPNHVKIRNPAFELVPKKYIKAIISELGILSYESFLKKIRDNRKI